MTIGFILTDISELTFFKEVVSAYPQFDYAAYVDLEHTVEDALRWLKTKNVSIVSTSPNVIVQDINFVVVQFSDVHSYLGKQNTVGGVGKRRDIYTTVMTKEQDKRMAELLGGFFVEE